MAASLEGTGEGDGHAYLLMLEARREVGRTPPRPKREEERARAMTLDRAPTAEIAIFEGARRGRRRGEDWGERGLGFSRRG